MFPGFQLDPIYWLILGPAILFTLYAQWRMRSTYQKWGVVAASPSLEGSEVARRLLSRFGMDNVSVHATRGQLSDHYNPMKNTLHLSETTINSSSVAAMAVVAHEVGHAQQDAANSLLMKIRMGIVPLVNLGSQIGPIVFIAGLTLGSQLLTWVGILLFGGAFLFALVTLPVELNASKRAMDMLTETGMIANEEERKGARQVLSAAALTYVAGMLTALFQVLYLVIVAFGGRRPDRDGPN